MVLDSRREAGTRVIPVRGQQPVDPDGNPVGVEDAFTKLAAARAHYEAIGLGASYADRFLR